MAWNPDWKCQARCRSFAPDDMFVTGKQQNRQVEVVCAFCPVRTECLATALDGRYRYGVWGMTERQRRALLLRRPDVVSWRALLEAARDRALTAA